MAKMYAWSVFHTKVNEWAQPIESVQPGEEVTQSKLGVTEVEWNELISVGAVRALPYPDVPAGVSPAEHFRVEDAALAMGELTDKEAKAVLDRQAAQRDASWTDSAPADATTAATTKSDSK